MLLLLICTAQAEAFDRTLLKYLVLSVHTNSQHIAASRLVTECHSLCAAQAQALDRVLLKNTVALSVLLRAHTSGTAMHVTWDFSQHPIYPLMVLKTAKAQ